MTALRATSPMADRAAQDPSMDDILLSIRKIIAEENERQIPQIKADNAVEAQLLADPAQSTAHKRDAKIDWSILDAILEEQIAPQRPAVADTVDVKSNVVDSVTPPPTTTVVPSPSRSSIAEALEKVKNAVIAETAKIINRAKVDPLSVQSIADVAEEEEEIVLNIHQVVSAAPVVSDTVVKHETIDHVSENLNQLAQASAQINQHVYAQIPLTDVGDSLSIEKIARDLLRPMLKEWLDKHLNDVVERAVKVEIELLSACALNPSKTKV